MIKHLLAGLLLALAALGAQAQVTPNCQLTGVFYQGCAINATTVTASTAFVAANGSASAPTYRWTNATDTGFYSLNATSIVLTANGQNEIGWNTSSQAMRSAYILQWSSGDPTAQAADTGLSRLSAGVIAVGTGAASSVAGSMSMAALTTTGVVALAGGSVQHTLGGSPWFLESSGIRVLNTGATNLAIQNNAANANRMSITDAGAIALGTAGQNITVTGLTTGTNADFLCLSAGGVILLQTSACTISSLRFKEKVREYSGSGLSVIGALHPIAFTMKVEQKNADWNYDQPQIGLSAENVAEVVPMAAIYEQDGKTPKSYRQESLLAVAVKAIQEQQEQINSLKKRLRK